MDSSEQHTLQQATESAVALGVPKEMAQWGTDIAIQAGSQPTRSYHTVAHFHHLIDGADALPSVLHAHHIHEETTRMLQHAYRIVGRDHDVVYLGADNQTILPHILDRSYERPIPATTLEQMPDYINTVRDIIHRNYLFATDESNATVEGLALGIGKYLKPKVGAVPETFNAWHAFEITGEDKAAKLTPKQRQNLAIALAAFGKDYGSVLYPGDSGQNEFLSCLHSLEVNPGITPKAKIAIAAMHQATIPFQPTGSIEKLIKRVTAIEIDGKPALTAEEAHAIGLAAAHFANRDVGAFRASPKQFQHESIQLMQESRGDYCGPVSNVGRIQRRLWFLGDIPGKQGREIFPNYTYTDETGAPQALYSTSELAVFNQTAKTLIAEEQTRLTAMKKVAEQFEESSHEAELADIAHAAGRINPTKGSGRGKAMPGDS